MLRAAVAIVLAVALESTQPTRDDAFRVLRQGYATRNAALAATAYAPNAILRQVYAGEPVQADTGRAAIERSFAAFFGRIADSDSLDLNFRVASRQGSTATGFYRLRIGTRPPVYGRFRVQFAGDGLFAFDESTDATAADFNTAPGRIMFPPPARRR